MWKRRSTSSTTSVDVDLNDFDSEQLLQGLIDDKWITEDEAADIVARSKWSRGGSVGEVNLDGERFDRIRLANHEILAGRRNEALHHIEEALGGDFIGRLAQ